jgi:hypothetical protein
MLGKAVNMSKVQGAMEGAGSEAKHSMKEGRWQSGEVERWNSQFLSKQQKAPKEW